MHQRNGIRALVEVLEGPLRVLVDPTSWLEKRMTSATAVQRDMAGGFAYPSYGCHKNRGRAVIRHRPLSQKPLRPSQTPSELSKMSGRGNIAWQMLHSFCGQVGLEGPPLLLAERFDLRAWLVSVARCEARFACATFSAN
jgi:hypothetical protein